MNPSLNVSLPFDIRP